MRLDSIRWILCAIPCLAPSLILTTTQRHYTAGTSTLLEYGDYALFAMLFVIGLVLWFVLSWGIKKRIKNGRYPLYYVYDTLKVGAEGLEFEKRGLLKWEKMREVTESSYDRDENPHALFIKLSDVGLLRIWSRSNKISVMSAHLGDLATEIYERAPHVKPQELIDPTPWRITADAVEINDYPYLFRHMRGLTVQEVYVEESQSMVHEFYFDLRNWQDTLPKPPVLKPLQAHALVRRFKQVSSVPLKWENHGWSD